MSESPPSTQISSSSSRIYSSVILFQYDVNKEFPFISVALDDFEGSNFPFDLISGHLGLEDRLTPREISTFKGSKLCLFAKIESGKPLA